MNIEVLLNNLARLVFFGASAAIALAFVEGIVQLFGTSLIGNTYAPGRLLELAATLLVFVAVLLLRQIREELRTGNSGS